MTTPTHLRTGLNEDLCVMHSMGYAHELARSMGWLSNFAISFSIICILFCAFVLMLASMGEAANLGWG